MKVHQKQSQNVENKFALLKNMSNNMKLFIFFVKIFNLKSQE